MRRSVAAVLLAAVAGAASVQAAAAASAPVPMLFWSEANAFAGRNGYADVGANPSSAERLLSDMAAGTSAYLSGEAKARTVVAFVADDLSRKELTKYGATRLQWLQQQFKDAASSLVIPSFIAHKAVKQDLVRFVNFDAEQSSVAEIVASLQTPTSNPRVIAVRVPGILAESVATLVKEVTAAAEQNLAGDFITVVTGRTSSETTTDLPESFDFGVSEPVESPTRKLLAVGSGSNSSSTGVHSSPAIMAGTLAGLALTFVLAMTVSCLASIDSSPRMFRQPPGPKEGDPQFNGTPREGTRFYPYRNLPQPEH